VENTNLNLVDLERFELWNRLQNTKANNKTGEILLNHISVNYIACLIIELSINQTHAEILFKLKISTLVRVRKPT
jgi:hypothetical protein